MAKFTKGHGKKHYRRKQNISDRITMAAKEMLMDKKMGYEIPAKYYEEKYQLQGVEK